MFVRDRTILVVDDESAIRDIIKRKVTAATDFKVIEAENGFDALKKIKEHKVDLVVTDIKMPRMTGIELLNEIRRAGLDIPVVIITGYGTLDDAIDALRLGAFNFIKKPFQNNELLSVIDKVFTLHEEEVHLKDVLPFVEAQTAQLTIPNDPRLFQGVIAFVNELAKDCWADYVSGAVDIKICLFEALLNAFEHGNLEINNQEKGRLLETSPIEYEAYLTDRMKLEPYVSRKIYVSVDVNSERAVISVADEGQGFDVLSLPDPTDHKNIMKNSGRGLLLIKSIMSDMSFNESGNKIIMTIFKKTKE